MNALFSLLVCAATVIGPVHAIDAAERVQVDLKIRAGDRTRQGFPTVWIRGRTMHYQVLERQEDTLKWVRYKGQLSEINARSLQNALTRMWASPPPKLKPRDRINAQMMYVVDFSQKDSPQVAENTDLRCMAGLRDVQFDKVMDLIIRIATELQTRGAGMTEVDGNIKAPEGFPSEQEFGRLLPSQGEIEEDQ